MFLPFIHAYNVHILLQFVNFSETISDLTACTFYNIVHVCRFHCCFFFFFISDSARQTHSYLIGNKGSHCYNGNKMYKCGQCSKVYKTQKGIDNHVCSKCTCCEKTSQHTLTKHKCNTQVRIYQCEKCSKNFKTLTGLHKHICNICPICRETFSSRQRCASHKCTPQLTYSTPQLKCEQCNRHFIAKHKFDAHKCAYCPICSKKFSSFTKYKQHFNNTRLSMCNRPLHDHDHHVIVSSAVTSIDPKRSSTPPNQVSHLQVACKYVFSFHAKCHVSDPDIVNLNADVISMFHTIAGHERASHMQWLYC